MLSSLNEYLMKTSRRNEIFKMLSSNQNEWVSRSKIREHSYMFTKNLGWGFYAINFTDRSMHGLWFSYMYDHRGIAVDLLLTHTCTYLHTCVLGGFWECPGSCLHSPGTSPPAPERRGNQHSLWRSHSQVLHDQCWSSPCCPS